MEALAHPSPDAEDDTVNCPMVKNQLLPGLRSFCSALRGKLYHRFSKIHYIYSIFGFE